MEALKEHSKREIHQLKSDLLLLHAEKEVLRDCENKCLNYVEMQERDPEYIKAKLEADSQSQALAQELQKLRALVATHNHTYSLIRP